MKKISLLPLSFILLIGFGLYWVYASSISIVGKYGVLEATGSFSPGGNAGTVTLMNPTEETTAGIPGVTLEGTNILTGNLFLQSVGYVHFGHSTVSVVPPAGSDSNLLLPWAITGPVWSTNAGWISLDSQNPSMYSGVYYIPATGSFTGLAWSSTLGYIDFSQGGGASENGLVGRVKVIGNAGGTSTFDSLFLSSNGIMRTNSVLTPFVNNLHKNMALLTRNATGTTINTLVTTKYTLGNLLYYKLSGGTVSLSIVTDFCSADDKPRSIIVDGGDILIDGDITGSKKSCAIIALSNGTTGGNIYLSDTPKIVESYIIAEGSVYAGTSSANLYNDAKSKLSSLPQSQLYIRGGVISHNTIGGATTDKVALGACPYTETACDRNTAIKYDLNFFRNYTKRPVDRAYTKDDSLENYSIIIEYDSRSAGDPPPGL